MAPSFKTPVFSGTKAEDQDFFTDRHCEKLHDDVSLRSIPAKGEATLSILQDIAQ